MTTKDMARKLRRLAGNTRMQILNHQDCMFLVEVSARLDELEERVAIMTEGREPTQEQLRFPPKARLLTLDEIAAAPDGSVLWEEVRIDWQKFAGPPETQAFVRESTVDVDIAPVEKVGEQLNGSGCVTYIQPKMFGDHNSDWIRYWDARPTDQEREAAAWA